MTESNSFVGSRAVTPARLVLALFLSFLANPLSAVEITPSTINVDEGVLVYFDVIRGPSDYLPTDAQAQQDCLDIVGTENATWYHTYQIVGTDGSATWGEGGNGDLEIYSDDDGVLEPQGSVTGTWWSCYTGAEPPSHTLSGLWAVFANEDIFAEGTESALVSYDHLDSPAQSDTATVNVFDQTPVNTNPCMGFDSACGSIEFGTLDGNDCDDGPDGENSVWLTEYYTFDVTQGDLVTSYINGGIGGDPGWVYLTDPSDNVLAGGTVIENIEILQSGEHRIWVSGISQETQGNYQMHLECEGGCEPFLFLNCPGTGDPDSFVDGCYAQINGAVNSQCPDPVEWDWDDGSPLEALSFPAGHTYTQNGDYVVSAFAGEFLDQCGVAIEECTTPDTVVINFFNASPDTIFEGESTTLSWSVSNANSCTANGGAGSWPGTSISLPSGSTVVTINDAGVYDFTLTCNDETGSDSETIEVVVEGPGPDLAVTDVGPSSRNLMPLESFFMDGVVENLGNSTAGPSTARFLVSTNSIISLEDTLFGTAAVPALAPDAFWFEGVTGTAPSQAGTYYVGMCVDEVADEFNTDNNCGIGGTITVMGSASCQTGALSCGQSVSGNLSAGDCLQGPRGPEHYSEPYVLSGSVGDTVWIDADWSFDGYLVLQGPNGLTVAQNDNDTSSFNSHIEYTFTQNGTHTVWATSFAPLTGGNFDLSVDCQGPQGPDLTVNTPSIDVADPLPGASIQLSARVNNMGVTASDSTTLRWRLSSDSLITASDPVIAMQSSAGLAAGANRVESRATVAPGTPGRYYIGACVDAVSDESSTSNNCSGGAQIQVGQEVACESSQLSCGGFANGALTTLDCSDGPRGRGYFAEEYTISAVNGASLAISADWTNFDGFLYLLGPGGNVVAQNDNVTDSLNNDESFIEIIVPQTGEYSIWATTFARGRTGNFDLSVDCGSATAPDLVTTARLISDPVVNVGDPITIEYEIRNVGDIPSNPTALAMCESPNPVISLNDTGRGTADVESILPGSAVTRQMTIAAPDQPGTFYFGPCVFATEGESLVDNNCAQPDSQSQIEVAGRTRPQQAVGGGALARVSNGAVCSSSALSCGQNTSGALGPGDCDLSPRGTGYYADAFSLNATAGDILTIDAAWSGIDGYLYLQSPNGDVVVENDDFGGAGSSRYEYEVESSGTYRIWPTTFAQDATGSYDLSVDCNSPTAPDLVVDTPTLSATSLRPGQNLTVSTVARNSGSGPSDGSKVRYLLSQTPQLTNSAVELGRGDMPGLAAGGSSARSRTVRMPTTAGDYYMGVCADFDVLELETDNNCAMSDQFTIEATNDPIDINVGLNDAWFNPATAGQGFFINVFPNSNQLFLAWFTYDVSRPPGNVTADLGDPGHRWRTAFGTFDQGVAALNIELTRGGVFDNAPPQVSQSMDGTIELRFSDCNHGLLSYNIPSVNRQGVIPIQRISFDNTQECEQLIGAVPTGQSNLTAGGGLSRPEAAGGSRQARIETQHEPALVGINAGLNDAWYNPATNGQGFFVNVFPNSSQLFLAWFTYETSRPPANTPAQLAEAGHRWLTAFGEFSGDEADLDIEITTGGVFDSGSPMPTQVVDGSMTLTFGNCNDGMVSYNIPSIGRSGMVPIERIGLDSVPNCEVASTGGQSDTESLVPQNKTEVANLCNQGGGTVWEFDWPDVDGANLYAIQAFSPDNPLSPNNDRPEGGFEGLSTESRYEKAIDNRIENNRRIGWQWRYKPLFGAHKLAQDWSEAFSFDVRPEEDPCLD